MSKKIVLGVSIDDISKEDALKKVATWLFSKNEKPKLIFTPGPEFLVTVQSDLEFKKILNSADLNLPDGFGLQLYGGIKNRIPGIDFMLDLCRLAEKNNWSIGLVGREDGLVKNVVPKTISKLILICPNIKIDNKNPDILFVGLGHPRQEKFLNVIARRITTKQSINGTEKIATSTADAGTRNDTATSFRVGMGVGGAFDYISGGISRPNIILRSLGLEWFWRLLVLHRWKRIFKATFVFPFLLLKVKLNREMSVSS